MPFIPILFENSGSYRREKTKKSKPDQYKIFSLLFLLSFLPSCSYIEKKSEVSLEFKGEQVFEKGKTYKGLKVGGLSELFFDKSSGSFFALSDDKKNHRFYKLSLKTKPQYKMEIKEMIFLKTPGHKRLKRNMDPEALVLYGKDKIFIASEGQQIYETHEPTQIFTFNKRGVLKEAWPVPSVFWKKGKIKQDPFFGQQENKGFESLTLDKKANRLWTATEKPLKQDLISRQKSFVRLSLFDIESKKMLAQYPYALKEEKGGLTALQWIKPKMFISLERVYKKQKNKGMNEVDIFLTDCRQAGNVQACIKLSSPLKTCSKKQLWNSSGNSSIQVDNLEAMALGPMLSSEKQLLVLASDNNFNEEKQKSQFLFFELHIKSQSQN